MCSLSPLFIFIRSSTHSMFWYLTCPQRDRVDESVRFHSENLFCASLFTFHTKQLHLVQLFVWESNLLHCISYVTFRMHVAFFVCVIVVVAVRFRFFRVFFIHSIKSWFYLKTNFQTHLKRSTVCDWTFRD